MTNEKSQLFVKIRTRAEAKQARAEIEQLLTSLYEGEAATKNALTKIRAWVLAIITEEMPKDAGGRKEYLERIVSQIDQLEELTLVLAFEPSERTLTTICSYIRQSSGVDVILDLQFDPTILAGIKISFRGLYKDFSLIQHFDQEFAKQASVINI